MYDVVTQRAVLRGGWVGLGVQINTATEPWLIVHAGESSP